MEEINKSYTKGETVTNFNEAEYKVLEDSIGSVVKLEKCRTKERLTVRNLRTYLVGFKLKVKWDYTISRESSNK